MLVHFQYGTYDTHRYTILKKKHTNPKNTYCQLYIPNVSNYIPFVVGFLLYPDVCWLCTVPRCLLYHLVTYWLNLLKTCQTILRLLVAIDLRKLPFQVPHFRFWVTPCYPHCRKAPGRSFSRPMLAKRLFILSMQPFTASLGP